MTRRLQEPTPRRQAPGQARRSLAELWREYTPHADIIRCIDEVHHYVASAPQRALKGRAPIALRSACTLSRTIHEHAVGVHLVHPGWWDAVRRGPMTAPTDPTRSCLFLMAAAWKWATVLVAEPLGQRQIHEIGQALTNYKSAARGLPAYVQYEIAEALDADQRDRSKAPGARLVPVEAVGDELRV